MVFGPRRSIKLSGRIYSLGEIAGGKKKHTASYLCFILRLILCM